MREAVKMFCWGVVTMALAMIAGCQIVSHARADENPWSREIATGELAKLHPATIGVWPRNRDVRLPHMLAGVDPTLAAKAREIEAACGSRVISGVRHTRVAGTRRLSLHASGRAVDLVGNPACIYRMLAGWPGGYTTDYRRARHTHVSYGGSEHGLRFAHRFTGRTKYAARRSRHNWRG